MPTLLYQTTSRFLLEILIETINITPKIKTPAPIAMSNLYVPVVFGVWSRLASGSTKEIEVIPLSYFTETLYKSVVVGS